MMTYEESCREKFYCECKRPSCLLNTIEYNWIQYFLVKIKLIPPYVNNVFYSVVLRDIGVKFF